MRQTLTINGQKSIMSSTTNPLTKEPTVLTMFAPPTVNIYRVEWRYHGVLSYHDCVGLDNATDNVRRLSACPSVSAITLFMRLSGTWVERPLPTL